MKIEIIDFVIFILYLLGSYTSVMRVSYSYLEHDYKWNIKHSYEWELIYKRNLYKIMYLSYWIILPSLYYIGSTVIGLILMKKGSYLNGTSETVIFVSGFLIMFSPDVIYNYILKGNIK